MGSSKDKTEYWNHNVAYHQWIIRQIDSDCDNILDVGCGEGLLLEKLFPYAKAVVGIDPDPIAINHAVERLSTIQIATLICDDFITHPDFQMKFDRIIFVAAIHHMDAESALIKAKSLLKPAGKVLIVGCAKSKSPTDWFIDILRTPFAKPLSWLHKEYDPCVAITEPTISLSEMTVIAKSLFNNVVVRIGLYYRYLMTCQ